MKVLAIVQNKGGVGKTTVARLLAEYFASRGVATVALDLDPQCNYSRRFLTMDFELSEPDGILPPLHPGYSSDDEHWTGRSSTADIYFAGEVLPYPTKWDSLEIIPGEGPKLRDIELVRKEEVKQRVHDRLREFLNLKEVSQAYELAIIDTSPSKGPLTVSAVRAATHLLIPTTMEPQPIEGLHGMLQLWRREIRRRELSDKLEILGIVPNMVRKGVALHEGYYQSLKADETVAPLLSPVMLRQRIAFAESDHPGAEPSSVFDLPTRDPARQEATMMCEFVQERLFGDK